MNWQHLRNTLVNCYHEQPQQTAMVDLALKQVQDGLQMLARLGHVFHLAEGVAPPRRLWPRRVFHIDHPQGFFCLCEEDFSWLGEGWFDTLDDAKHAKGMEEQFRRGGIFPKKGLPVPVDLEGKTRLDKERGNGFGNRK